MFTPKLGWYNENSARNATMVEIAPGKVLFFSYQTVVAFYDQRPDHWHPLTVIQNQWGATTGKHLNWLDGGSNEAKRKRLTPNDFYTMLEKFINNEPCRPTKEWGEE